MRTAQRYDRALIEEALHKRGITPFKGETVDAYVNHGRWVADCPVCNGAELVAPGETILCGSCGAEHAVRFPSTRPKVEEVLTPRPTPHQNWRPGESVSELRAENIEHGILPDDFKE